MVVGVPSGLIVRGLELDTGIYILTPFEEFGRGHSVYEHG